MKLADLKDTLTSIADEAPVGDAPGRLAGVETKVAGARRSRLVAASVAATVIVTAGAVVTQQAITRNSSSPDPVEHPDKTTGLPVVEDNGVSFYRSPAGNTLVGSAVGEPGEAQIDTTATPQSANLAVAVYCTGAEGMADIEVNGHPLYGSSCSDRPGDVAQAQGMSGDGSASSNAASWTRYFDVVAGRPVELTVRFRPEDKDAAGTPQLGVALYEMTGKMIEDHGQWISTEVVNDGRTFRLVDSAFARFEDGSEAVALPRPGGEGDVWAVTGVAGVSSGYRTRGPSPDEGTLNKTRGLSQSGSILDAAVQVARARVKTHGDPTGLIYLLLYEEVR